MVSWLPEELFPAAPLMLPPTSTKPVLLQTEPLPVTITLLLFALAAPPMEAPALTTMALLLMTSWLPELAAPPRVSVLLLVQRELFPVMVTMLLFAPAALPMVPLVLRTRPPLVMTSRLLLPASPTMNVLTLDQMAPPLTVAVLLPEPAALPITVPEAIVTSLPPLSRRREFPPELLPTRNVPAEGSVAELEMTNELPALEALLPMLKVLLLE